MTKYYIIAQTILSFDADNDSEALKKLDSGEYDTNTEDEEYIEVYRYERIENNPFTHVKIREY